MKGNDLILNTPRLQKDFMLYRSAIIILLSFIAIKSYGQQQQSSSNMSAGDTAAHYFSLNDANRYALQNQPALQQSLIDESIAHVNKRIALSTWLPQITGTANYQHYFELPTTFFPVNGVVTPIKTGVNNTSIPQLNVTQNIFSADAVLANKASKLGIEAAVEKTVSTKIDLVTNVSRAYYDVLLSVEQINVFKEDTQRLRKNQSDAYNRYLSGVSDKVDYKQATIALNNSMAQLKTASEALGAKYANLKLLMGYPAEKTLNVRFDTVQMMQNIYADTTAPLRPEKRIEYQQLQTMRRIQHETTQYYRLNWIPTIQGFYNYAHEYESYNNSDLFSQGYPYSYIGAQLSIPIFTGFKRVENVKKSRLQEDRIDWDDVALKLSIYADYRQALADYKSNLTNLNAQKENVGMATEVYDIVKLQYTEGIKAYLDVIVAESDLKTSEINYQNALFQLLESKVSLEKAMGDTPTQF